MDRVEGAAEDATGSGHAGRASQGSASHSGPPPDLHEVTGRMPARRSSPSMPIRSRSRWKRSADLLDVEVRLGRDPLDPLAADPERTVSLGLDGEPVRCRLDAVHDHARRLGWRIQLFGGRQQRAEPFRKDVQALAG